MRPYLIFAMGTTGGTRGEKDLSCGETCPHVRFSCGQILHITDCHVDKFSTWQIVMWKKNILHMRNVKTFVMWRNNVYNLWCFVAFNAVLLSWSWFTQFCRDLRAFEWRKIQPRIGPVEKITNIRYAVHCTSVSVPGLLLETKGKPSKVKSSQIWAPCLGLPLWWRWCVSSGTQWHFNHKVACCIHLPTHPPW